jgi:flavodoxin
MNKVLIAYDSRTGNTEKMAELIAEGIRISGQEAELMKITEIKKAETLQGYDAYIFGCPTYHRDMTQGMKTFLFLVQRAGLEGKVGGAFGSYTHSGDAPGLIFDTMEYVFKMKMTSLGSFNMKEDIIPTGEGIRACQDYGKGIGEQVSK